jgi:hypothetical protein
MAVVGLTTLTAGCPSRPSPGDSSSGIDASSDGVDTARAAECGDLDAGDACNALAAPGVFIVTANASGPWPIATGGALADGRYVATRVDAYIGPPGMQPDGGATTTNRMEVVEVCGSVLTQATWTGDRVVRSTFELGLTGSTMTWHATCPSVDPGPPYPYHYTVNADGSWVLINASEGYASVTTYVRMP